MAKVNTNVRQIRGESVTEPPPVRYKTVPLLGKFRGYLRKEVANLPQTWLPIECSLLICYEFATLPPQTRYVFVAILLYCGARGIDEIPMDIRFLANALAVDDRTLAKSLEELEFCGLLIERKKEREDRKEKTDRQKDENGGVCVDSPNLFQNESANDLSKNDSTAKVSPRKNLSQFSIEECLKYVELCKSDGETVKSPKALANHLCKTGDADAFIMATLYPEKQQAVDLQTFGAPRPFSDKPCSICYGAKMADVDDKGFRACQHCKNEKGKSTGFEPQIQP